MNKYCATIFLAVVLQSNTSYSQEVTGSDFTYQGRLNYEGVPADGSYSFEFGLYNAQVEGTQIGTTIPLTVEVEGGLFSAPLDFGSEAFRGENRWLECVIISGSTDEEQAVLTPRSKITPAPHSIFASTAGDSVRLGGIAAESYSKFNWKLTSSNTNAEPENGYLTTGTTRTDIQLPENAGIGDTIRVSGIGQLGWRVTQRANQTILCSALEMSTAQQRWTERSRSVPVGPSLNMQNNWRDIVSSSDGQRLYACTYGHIYTSNDGGINWFDRSNSINWISIACSADGRTLVAAPDSGYLYVSMDYGASWAQREAPRSWRSVFVSSDGSRMAAIGNGYVYVSSDFGVTWAQRLSTSSQWVCGSDDGMRLTVLEYSRIALSEDYGVTWNFKTVQPIPNNPKGIACSGDGNSLALLEHNGILVSENRGNSWSRKSLGPISATINTSDMAMSKNGSHICVVGSASQIYTSVDFGSTWIPRDYNRNWSGITTSADGSTLAACVSGGFIYTSKQSKLLKTTPGVDGFITGGPLSSVELQYVGNSTFMPIGSLGVISGK